MSPKQTALYWREWAAVRRAMPDADRHELHLQALGLEKSSKEFDNADLDKVLATFRAISRPGDLNGQLRQMDQPRIRLMFVIRNMAPVAYRDAIMLARFKTTRLEDLTEEQLTQLRFTLNARKQASGRRTKPTAQTHIDSVPHPAATDGVDCPF